MMTDLASIKEDQKELKDSLIVLAGSVNEIAKAVVRWEERDHLYSERFQRIEKDRQEDSKTLSNVVKMAQDNRAVTSLVKWIAGIVGAAFVGGFVTAMVVWLTK